MSLCYSCKRPFTKTDGKIACTHTTCNRAYHLACVGIRTVNVKKIATWSCPICAPKTASTLNPEHATCGPKQEGSPLGSPLCQPEEPSQPKTSPSTDSQIPSGDLTILIQKIIKSEIGTMRSQMCSIENTLTHMSDQYDDLLKTIKSSAAEIKKLKEENTLLRNTVDEHSTRIKSLEDENARQQQWSRLQNIEVVGIPESKEEDTTQVVAKLVEKIGVKIGGDELEFAHRVQSRKPSSSTSGRTIIARFRHRHTKDVVIAAARKHRNLKPSDVGLNGHNTNNNNIFINEHLTKSNRALLNLAKQKAKEAQYKYVWTKNCRIFVRRNEKSPPIPIITSTDLSKIC